MLPAALVDWIIEEEVTATGREVPTLLLWEEEDLLTHGPLINEDIFLGGQVTISAPPSPPATRSVAFVEPHQEVTGPVNGGFSLFNGTSSSAAAVDLSKSYPPQQQQQNTHHLSHYQQNHSFPNFPLEHEQHGEPSWFDQYVDLEAFGSSTKSLPTENFSTQPSSTFGSSADYEPAEFFSNQLQHQSSVDHRMQDLTTTIAPSTLASNSLSSFQFSQMQEQMISLESNSGELVPPIPESEYSASYSAPGSSYSTDAWSSGSDHSSAHEILEEIHRECAEIERKSLSPPATSRNKHHKNHVKAPKHRASTANRASPIPSTSSTSSINAATPGAGTSERKKELNRIAATKYREKKRLERELTLIEHDSLEKRNRELRSTLKDLKTEVGYLRKLMKDMEARAENA